VPVVDLPVRIFRIVQSAAQQGVEDVFPFIAEQRLQGIGRPAKVFVDRPHHAGQIGA